MGILAGWSQDVVRVIGPDNAWDDVREWAVAAGTLSAAALALWVGVLKDWWNRPKLSLHFSAAPSQQDIQVVEAFQVGAAVPRSTRAAFIRLRVKNEEGKNTANNVEVLLERIIDRETQPPEDIPLGINLLPWSNVDPQGRSIDIPPGVDRHVDLFYVAERGIEAGSIVVTVYPLPIDHRNKIRPREVEFHLVVSASNANPHRYTVRASYTGTWGLPITANVRVEQPSPRRS